MRVAMRDSLNDVRNNLPSGAGEDPRILVPKRGKKKCSWAQEGEVWGHALTHTRVGANGAIHASLTSGTENLFKRIYSPPGRLPLPPSSSLRSPSPILAAIFMPPRARKTCDFGRSAQRSWAKVHFVHFARGAGTGRILFSHPQNTKKVIEFRPFRPSFRPRARNGRHRSRPPSQPCQDRSRRNGQYRSRRNGLLVSRCCRLGGEPQFLIRHTHHRAAWELPPACEPAAS